MKDNAASWMLAVGLVILTALPSSGTDPVWHEQDEHDLKWCHISPDRLVLKGHILCDTVVQAVTVEIEFEAIPEVDLKKALLGKAKLYGLAGAGGIQDATDTVIKSVAITIGQKVLTVPSPALDGILNPLIPSGVRLESASNGYFTLTLLGSAGERAYTCCFIFRDWQFDSRQVTKDGGKTTDTFRL
jgi:hypothetical protein